MIGEPESGDVEFRQRLRTAIAADLRLLTDGLADDEVAGAGVYTDADASNIVVAVQTRQHLDGLIQRRPRYRNYFRWSMGEWDRRSFEALKDDALKGINDELATMWDMPRLGDARDEWRSALWEEIVEALAGIVSQGHLNRFSDAVRAFEPMDGDVDEKTIRGWTARINDKVRLAEYDAWRKNPSS